MTGCRVKVSASKCFGFTYARSTPGVYSKYSFGGVRVARPSNSVLGIDDGHQVVAAQIAAGSEAAEAATDDQHATPHTKCLTRHLGSLLGRRHGH